MLARMSGQASCQISRRIGGVDEEADMRLRRRWLEQGDGGASRLAADVRDQQARRRRSQARPAMPVASNGSAPGTGTTATSSVNAAVTP